MSANFDIEASSAELADAVEQFLDRSSHENRDVMEEALGRYREAAV